MSDATSSEDGCGCFIFIAMIILGWMVVHRLDLINEAVRGLREQAMSTQEKETP